MMTVRKASERGRSQADWLDSRHTFSFGDYRDPNHAGFGRLRVINEDIVAPATGFGRHPHRDMEILSYVLDGALEHGDSMGNGSIIRPGDVQIMSAGTGIVHSERNPSSAEPVHFLQIWIEPDRRGIMPRYEQKRFDEPQAPNTLRLIASHDGREGAVTLNQDVRLYTGLLDAKGAVAVPLDPGRRVWIQVVRGKVRVENQTLGEGDGAAIEGDVAAQIAGEGPTSEVLVFDLA